METVQDEQKGRELGQHIVVLDRGWVYVGLVTELPDRLVLDAASCIRRWGTTRGLGELRYGPNKGTILDPAGQVIVYRHAVIHMIPCKGF